MLKNDVLAHQATVETVNKAGNELLESSAGDDASSLRNRLEKLNACWESVLQKTEEREQQLQSTLQQVRAHGGYWPAQRELLLEQRGEGLETLGFQCRAFHLTVLEQCSAQGQRCASFTVRFRSRQLFVCKTNCVLCICQTDMVKGVPCASPLNALFSPALPLYLVLKPALR